MEVVFEETKAFLRDIKKFDPRLRALLVKRINELTEPHTRRRRMKLRLPWELTSSLYVLAIDRNYRLVHSVDSDPIFDELVIRLYRCVKHDRLHSALVDLAQKLRVEDEMELELAESQESVGE